MRKAFKLNHAEWRQVRALPPVQGIALQWWHNKAISLGLDPKTLLMCDDGWRFTGLPLGHGKHWCWPIDLKCRFIPKLEIEVVNHG